MMMMMMMDQIMSLARKLNGLQRSFQPHAGAIFM